MIIKFFLYLFSFSHSISISLTQICFGILALFFLYDLIYKKQFINMDKKIIFLFCLFFLWYSLSVFINYHNLPNLKKLIKEALGWWHYLIFFVIVFLTYIYNIDRKKVLYFLYMGGSISACYGIIQFLEGYGRARGFLTHPLTYGNVIGLILIILYVSFLIEKKKTFFFLFLLIGVGFFLSLSRGPIISVIIVMLVFNMLHYKLRGLIFNLIIVLLLVVIVISYPPFKNRFSDFVNNSWKNSRSSFGTRLVLWKASIDIIKDNPIFGIGYNIKREFKHRIKVPVDSMAHSHNSYLTIAVYHGIPTLIILLMIFIRLLKMFYLSKDIFIRYAGIGVILVYMLEGLTEYNFGDTEVLMLFCFLVGLLYSQIIIREKL